MDGPCHGPEVEMVEVPVALIENIRKAIWKDREAHEPICCTADAAKDLLDWVGTHK